MFFAAGPVEAAISNASLGFDVPQERRGMVGYGSLDAVLNALEYAVSQAPYLAGDRFKAYSVGIDSTDEIHPCAIEVAR